MTPEEKRLLTIDLCGRLPYGVRIHIDYNEIGHIVADATLNTITSITGQLFDFIDFDQDFKNGDCCPISGFSSNKHLHIEDFKPYLRPMESMTKEEKKELLYKLAGKHSEKFKITKAGRVIEKENKKSWDFRNQSNFELVSFIDFCPKSISTYESFMYSKHLDFRGFIKKGLALAVTEDNNPYNKACSNCSHLY